MPLRGRESLRTAWHWHLVRGYTLAEFLDSIPCAHALELEFPEVTDALDWLDKEREVHAREIAQWVGAEGA